MKIPRRELAEAIAKRTMEVRDTSLLAREIAAYLLAENRVSELESVIRDVLAYRQAQGTIETTLLSAHELNGDVEQAVKHLLQEHYPRAKHVIVRKQLDPGIIGGLKVQLANEQLDMSVRAKLDTFKRLTSGGNV